MTSLMKIIPTAMNKHNWTYKKLGEVCDIFGRIGFRGYTRDDYVNTINEGAISLSPSNIINNQLDFSNCTYITWNKYNQSPEIKIYEGDVIFVKTASVGKCAYVSVLPHESTINPQFVVFKNISIFNRFLFYELLSPVFQYKVKEEYVFYDSSYRELDGYDRMAMISSVPFSSNLSVLRLLPVPFYI